MQGSGDARELAKATVDGEIASVIAAIELVAEGAALRVTIAGLHFGAALMPEAQRHAADRHVRVRPLWPMGDGPVGLVIETVVAGEVVEPVQPVGPGA